MIRIIVAGIFLILFLIGCLPIYLIEWIIGKFNMDVKNRSSQAIVMWAFRVILAIAGVRVTAFGEENIPKNQAVLYIGNHRSFFDILVTYVRIPGLCGYVSKKELKKVPLLNIWMLYLHCLFLDRNDIKQGLQTILTAIEYIKSGISIFIFPEGTRNKVPDTFLPFHEGSFKIASKSGCPIVPVSLYNTSGIFEDHLPFLKPQHVYIQYGTPIIPSDLPKESQRQLGAYTQSIIEKNYFKLKEIAQNASK